MNDILFGNNNKAVIKKLANRSFRSNKMRNVIAVIAIALTTFLFTAVLTIGMGAKGTLEYNMAKMIGTGADALVQGLSEEQFQQLKENSMFEKVGCWVPIEIMTNTNRMVAEIDYADQPQLELRMQTPRTGSAPQKANEVLVSANILKDLNIEEKIGAEIPIEFKNRQSGQMYYFDMVVSGIYDTPNEKSESVIVSKAFMKENPEMMSEIAQGREGCGIYDADVIMRDSSMVKERISEFVRSIGGNPDDRSAENYIRVAPNTFLSNNSGGSIMWLVAGVFGVLFMFCGYLLIYNVFEIAVTNDIRQYGLLRTVGTTSQQIKRLVNRQALYLFLIGTPFGLLFGILLGRSILPAALQMFAADYSGKNIEVSTLPYLGIIVGAILFSGLTVYISTRKAAVTSNEMTLTSGGSNIATDVGGPKIYMSENKFKEIYETPTLYGFLFDVEEQYQQDMENYLMRDTDVSYNSISTLKANVLGIKNVVLLVGGMIGAVFALVGLINFINLVMTNIVTRRHEFATMQSIGMTNRQLRKMMISESFSYVLLAGIVGTLVAATLGMTLLRAFVENGPTSMMMTFQITLLPALIMLVLFLVLAFIVPVVALRLLNNRSVVERLRVNE